MPAGFEAGRDDGIDASRIECGRLVAGSSRADRGDAFAAALVQDLPWRNTKDEAEGWYVRLEHHSGLIFESGRHVGMVCRTRCSQLREIGRQRGEAPVER